MAGCTSNEAPVTDEGLWKDARPTGASLPYPRDTPTIIARHRTAGTSQQDDLGTAVGPGGRAVTSRTFATSHSLWARQYSSPLSEVNVAHKELPEKLERI
jgi:hypothetical protein